MHDDQSLSRQYGKLCATVIEALLRSAESVLLILPRLFPQEPPRSDVSACGGLYL